MTQFIKTTDDSVMFYFNSTVSLPRHRPVKSELHQDGGALVEYTVFLLFMLLALFVPIGTGKHDPTVLGLLVTTLKDLYSGFSYAISISFEGLL
jgi:hypothetical protein